ncbi:MAG: TRAP transporter large permease [Pseudomonadota bacterium]
MTLLLTLLFLVTLLLVGVPVAFALGAVGLGLLFFADFSLLIVPQTLLSSVDSFVLLAVPLFLLMSNILLKGGVGHDLFAAVQAWVGHWPGGLAVTTIVSCGLFAAISGSSVATAATIGTVAIPEMVERGYPRRLVLGLLAAAGTLGILIPPSIPMIIYAFITEQSVIDLFLAGIGPGLILIVLFCGFSMIYVRLSTDYRPSQKATWALRLSTTRRALPSALLAIAIVAGIYAGAFTPTEAAAIGFGLSIFVTVVILRTMTWDLFKQAVFAAMKTTVLVLLIVAGAKLFGHAITLYRIPYDISQAIIAYASDPLVFVALVALVLLLMGLFLESLAMMLIMVPVLAPALSPIGIDPVWFGVFFVIMIEVALITPPVGMNLYVIQSVAKTSIGEVAAGVWPFILLMIATVAAIALFPGLALYLPFGLGL